MTENVRIRITECSTELDEIERIIEGLSPLDKSKQYLTKYALIKASGTLESAYHHIVADFLEKFKIPQFNYYISNNVRRNSLSVKYSNMTKFLGQFDANWEKTFKDRVSAKPGKDKLINSAESLVDNRHAFAHGASTTVSFGDVKNYYYDTLELIKEFDDSVV